MKNRNKLLERIAATIKDYRTSDLPAPTSEHVDRWIRQFETDVQLPLLHEMHYVLARTYFSQSEVRRFFQSVAENQKLAGSKPRDFWHSVRLLDIQQEGNSQAEIRQLFSDSITRKYGITAGSGNASNNVFIYLDDVLFSGGRVGNDLSQWVIKQCPSSATVHIVVIVAHHFGEYKCHSRLAQVARDAGKDVNFQFWAAKRVENRLAYSDKSEVLWPADIPDDPALSDYMAQEKKFPFEPRASGGQLQWPIFSSEAGRQLLERELLLAGMHIRSLSREPSPALRPLGFGPFGLGFGSMIVTYRNCPNNAPLALWWGDPNAATNHPFSRWYPLVQRRTYSTQT